MAEELLTLYLKYEALETKEMKAWRKGGIAWKQYCATMRNLERKIKNKIKELDNDKR